MPEEPNKLPSLEELNQRIKQVEDTHKAPIQEEPASNPSKVAIELLSGVAVGGFMGYWLDKWLGTKPLLFIVCLLLGFAGGFWNIYKMSQRSEDPLDRTNIPNQKK